MIKDLPTNLRISFLFLCVFFCANTNTFGQVIGPVALPFDKICADATFNDFSVTFNHQGFLDSANYVVILSDDSGNFDNPVSTIFVSIMDITATQKRIKFILPSNLIGSETYRLRVKETTTGITTGDFSTYSGPKTFPIYYKVQDSKFTINNFNPTATYCSGGSYVLSIDNPGIGGNDSPLKYPSLKYNWYKSNGLILPETLVAGNTGGTYTVTEPGIYYVRTNYGTCTSDSESNQVSVTLASSNTTTEIVSSLGNPFCPATGATILSVGTGASYQWSKDGVAITGAISQTYSATTAGLYTVKIEFGGCTGNGSINLQSEGSFTGNLNIPNSNTINVETGETLNVTVTSDAVDPSYKWYINSTLITDAITDSYFVTAVGNYKIEVTQTTGCTATKEFNFQVSDSNLKNIPNIVSLSSGFNTWDLPGDYKNAETNVMIVSSQGEVMFNGVDYDPSKWEIKDFKNINPVYYYIIKKGSDEKKGSITVIK
ncbi:hypothetical protein [Flavobacterium sp. 140616W15]|uniref:hypothetical protein n=1 Tax=Flavobacterium sp. 140616W15 TaxID=2478552 RepID=UPI000F0C31AB|nr:hypothetical protein [Flavobacterium sp. 140616W15]AYN05765.1 hypothetical protein EAG11_17620 [Flavobacterium sp. 140616W15]